MGEELGPAGHKDRGVECRNGWGRAKDRGAEKERWSSEQGV